MEKSSGSDIEIKMMPLNAGCNDLGAWEAFWQVGVADADGNVTNGDTLSADTTNTYIHVTTHVVSTVGLDNLVIVETADAVLMKGGDSK
jgi:mannose-1-phosphate guanylyltransferase/mannose-6-phosphate isomerase